MAATDVGGDAWATDSYEIRGLCRLDAVTMDPNAGFKALIDPSPAWAAKGKGRSLMSRRKSDTADPVQEAPAEKEAAPMCPTWPQKRKQRLCRSLWGRRTDA